MKLLMAALAGFVLLGNPAVAQVSDQPLPIIDMHLHALPFDAQGPPPVGLCSPMPMPVWDPQQPYPDYWLKLLKNPPCTDPIWSASSNEALLADSLKALESRNIIGVTSGPAALVREWKKAAPDRIISGLSFNVANPKAQTPEQLRQMFEDGSLQVLGEVTNQYSGVEPTDERMAPYWALAEELDIPVGIHVGTGPPGVIYLGSSAYRGRMHSALTMEEVLVRHPKLRVYVMHAGYPLLDDMLTLMYAHPQVYVDVGVIVFTQSREAFYRYIKSIFDAGFGKRVMFGSDQMVWPGAIERSIQVIEQAPFLTPSQKRDVLYNNAARFLRLSQKQIDLHHHRN